MKLVTVSGYAQSGKDTSTDICVEIFGGKKYQFSTKLKELAYWLNPTIKYVVDMYGWEQAKTFTGVREFLIELSEKAIKPVFGRDFWCKQIQPTLDADICWISDTRFVEEALWSTSLGGFNVRITRPGVEPVHESERMTWIPDVTIENDGTILDLRRKLINVFARTFGRVELLH